VKKLQNVSEQEQLEKAITILSSEPVYAYLSPLLARFKGDLSSLIAHRSTVAFQVGKILDIYHADWPQDAFDLFCVRALSEVFVRHRKNGGDQTGMTQCCSTTGGWAGSAESRRSSRTGRA
jgi:hypothetical protein